MKHINSTKSNNIAICYWPGRESNYSRNRVLLKAMTSANVCVIDCSSPHKNFFRYFQSFWKFLKSYQKCDIIFIGFLGHFLVPVARLLTQKPIVFDSFVSIYMTMGLDRKKFSPNGILAKISKWIDKKACQLSTLIICDTNEHIKFFSNTYRINSEKFIRIWVGSDDSIMHSYPEIKERQGLVHFHGEFQPLHGVENIIKAAALTPDANFRLIGNGTTRKQCENLAKELNLQNIEFLDPIPYEDLAKKMAEATICLGIFGDSLKTQIVIPHKVYEAMAMGKAIITAETPAVKELLTDGEDVLFCKAADPENLAKSINELLSNIDLKNSLAEKSHNTFMNNCSSSSIGKDILLALNKLTCINEQT